MLSQRLLDALNADRENCDEDMDLSPRVWYPNVMELYDVLINLENNPTMQNYDRWGLPRPHGIHSMVGNDNADTKDTVQEEH